MTWCVFSQNHGAIQQSGESSQYLQIALHVPQLRNLQTVEAFQQAASQRREQESWKSLVTYQDRMVPYHGHACPELAFKP